MFEWITAAALWAVLAGGTPADRPDDQWYCTLTESGSRGSGVSVAFQVTTSGELLSTTVSWSPPIASQDDPVKAYHDPPDLLLFYDNAGETGMGALTTLLGSATGLGGPRSAFKGMSLKVTVDGGRSWAVDLAQDELIPDINSPGGPFRFRSAYVANRGQGDTVNPDLLDAADAAAAVRVELFDRRGRAVGAMQYDVSDKAERDRLFALAWPKAKDLTQHLDRCEKANAEPPSVPAP